MWKQLISLALILTLAGCAAKTFEDAEQAEAQGDFDEAAEIWRELADAENGRALLALYRLHMSTGVGFDSDEEARDVLEQLATEAQMPEAQYRLALLLYAEREFEQVRDFMTAAADQGHGEARGWLDDHRGLLQRKIRTQRGSPRQQYQLGQDLYFGQHGVQEDHQAAAYWHRLAATGRNVDAQAMLAYQYLEGMGVVQDPEQAYEWYREAAMQGHGVSQGTLGYLYGQGLGIDQDDVMAYVWSVLGAENGHEQAERNRSVYLNRLSNRQRLEAHNQLRRIESLMD